MLDVLQLQDFSIDPIKFGGKKVITKKYSFHVLNSKKLVLYSSL